MRASPLVAFLIGLALAPCLARADDAALRFPNRPVTIVVPFPPAGPSDLTARLFGQKLSERWRQPVVIVNRPGANTALGALQVAHAEPDGYTLLAAIDSTLVMNPLTIEHLPYDPANDFTPVSLTALNTSLLLVPAKSGIDSVDALVARAKAAPGKLNYGAGTVTTRLGGYLVSKLMGGDAVFVPYKGSAEVAQALLSGAIDYAVDGVATNLPLVRSGQLRALAKLNARPLAPLPDLRTLSDSLPEFGDVSTWSAILAPAGTPPAIVDKLHEAIAAAAADPELVKALAAIGVSAASDTPAEFAAFVAQEDARWSRVIKDSGVSFTE